MKGEGCMQFERKLNNNNKGFTLVELIVTVVILALVTAPFLSSFISASNANVKSKRVEEANELSQYIIEQFKASSVDKLVNDYILTSEMKTIPGNAKQSQCYSGKLSKETTTGDLPSGFSDKYEADITLIPSVSVVNKDYAIPVIENLDRSHCAVFAQNITKFDASFSTAYSRVVTITISKDSIGAATMPYVVNLEVKYRDAANIELGRKTMEWYYDTVPSVYVLYNPLGNNDCINVQNNLYGDDLKDPTTGLSKSVSFYLINQKDLTNNFKVVSSDNITITEKQSATKSVTATLTKLLSADVNIWSDADGEVKNFNSTILYTNFGAVSNDRDYTVNGAVGMKKIETIYDLNVIVNYDGKKVASYAASKTLSN